MKTLTEDLCLTESDRCLDVGLHCPFSHSSVKTGGPPSQPKFLSNADWAQNSNNDISCRQSTHYSYLSQHHVRADALQAEPNKIFPVKGLGLFIFLPFMVQHEENFQIVKTYLYTGKSMHTLLNWFKPQRQQLQLRTNGLFLPNNINFIFISSYGKQKINSVETFIWGNCTVWLHTRICILSK